MAFKSSRWIDVAGARDGAPALEAAPVGGGELWFVSVVSLVALSLAPDFFPVFKAAFPKVVFVPHPRRNPPGPLHDNRLQFHAYFWPESAPALLSATGPVIQTGPLCIPKKRAGAAKLRHAA